MVRAEIFGLDPMFIFIACMLGVIILGFIILSNEDPLIIIINAGLLILATLIIGNLFEHSVYRFNTILQWSYIAAAPRSFIIFWFLDQDLVVIRGFTNIFMFIVIGILLFLTIVKGYNAYRGGWKTLHKDQFKEQ